MTRGFLLTAIIALPLGTGCSDDGGGRDVVDQISEDAAVDAADIRVEDGGEGLPDVEAPDDAEPPEDGAEAETADAPPEGDAPEEDAADGEDGGPTSGIPCGFGFCDEPNVCCVTEVPPRQDCMEPTACAGLRVSCDGPEDCGAGESCCMPSGAVMSTYCLSGTCPAGMTACHGVGDCGEGQVCCPDFVMGYSYRACRFPPCD